MELLRNGWREIRTSPVQALFPVVTGIISFLLAWDDYTYMEMIDLETREILAWVTGCASLVLWSVWLGTIKLRRDRQLATIVTRAVVSVLRETMIANTNAGARSGLMLANADHQAEERRLITDYFSRRRDERKGFTMDQIEQELDRWYLPLQPIEHPK